MPQDPVPAPPLAALAAELVRAMLSEFEAGGDTIARLAEVAALAADARQRTDTHSRHVAAYRAEHRVAVESGLPDAGLLGHRCEKAHHDQATHAAAEFEVLTPALSHSTAGQRYDQRSGLLAVAAEPVDAVVQQIKKNFFGTGGPGAKYAALVARTSAVRAQADAARGRAADLLGRWRQNVVDDLPTTEADRREYLAAEAEANALEHTLRAILDELGATRPAIRDQLHGLLIAAVGPGSPAAMDAETAVATAATVARQKVTAAISSAWADWLLAAANGAAYASVGQRLKSIASAACG